MLRSIKSGQRKMRIIAVKVAADDSLSGPDSKKVTCSSLAVSFNQSFAETPVVIAQSASGASDVALSSLSKSGVTVSEACDLLIIGSDTTDKH
tara:strand:+ start:81 stop:359 length:279 start_codon:yes stop_codon:yes gene_type:complete